MTHIPVVSVIMPVYNGERFLREAIDSILNQSFKDYEFIIIDDGSSDRSVDIIRQYKDARIVFIINDKNMKLPKTLNTGIAVARGKYIARMDCDDISMFNRIEEQVAFMDSHLDVGVCGCWMNIVNSYGEIVDYGQCRYEDQEMKIAMLFGECCLPHPGVIIRKQIMDTNLLKYDEKFLHAEDFELWMRLLRITKFANIRENLISYRIQDMSLSQLYSEETTENTGKVVLNFFRKLGIILTPQEEELHKSIFVKDLQIASSVKYFVLLEEWLLKLIKINEMELHFDRKIFNKIVSEKWTYAFITNEKKSIANFVVFSKSELLNGSNNKYKEIIKFYVYLRHKNLLPKIKKIIKR